MYPNEEDRPITITLPEGDLCAVKNKGDVPTVSVVS